MYLPKHFEISDLDEISRFISHVRAADLVTVSSTGLPIATLMPCVWDRSNVGQSHYGSLVMHMARANPQWKSIDLGALGLAIVHGSQAYVSPSNYEGKITDHKVVPTWNYQSVHLSGTVEVSEDVELLRQIVIGLTDFHESDRTTPWSAREADPKYFEAQLRGIVAVILHVTKIEAKYKLSQNRSTSDRERVVADLASSKHSGDHEIAAEMTKGL
ncbi:MAG TPA: FMN-binding negative transcriptional regulator [archaeon]|nr:FMN-binding negative transcriptional regulator [archaeon]